MLVERLLSINVAVMAALGSLLLGMGQGGWFLPTVAFSAAMTSVVFTDWLKHFRLHRNVASLLAIAAVGYALSDFFGHDSDDQLLSIANLLVYLQIILLFQRKNERVYWQLAVLSLLQVVVSAALNLGFEFGILLVVYMFVTFSALSLFFIYRETMPFARKPLRRKRRNLKPAFAVAGSAPPHEQRPYSQRRSRFVARRQEQTANRVIRWRFVAQVAWMGITTLALATTLFFLMPRSPQTVITATGYSNEAIVEFANEVSLRNTNTSLLSDKDVLRLTLFDQSSGEPIRLSSEPYLRGSVFREYSYAGGEGRWRPYAETRESFSVTLDRPPKSMNVVRQEVVLQPRHDRVLFAMFPVFDLPQTPGHLRFHPIARQLFHDLSEEDASTSEFRYSLGTTGIMNGGQLPITPMRRPLFLDETELLLRLDPARPQRFERLTQVAQEVVEENNAQNGDRLQVAKALEAHFRYSGLYSYSLDPDIERDESLDPVEDFVANHRMGHCEYYATALTLMLRSQGIPARMVGGYLGGEYNSLGNYWQIKEKDAHAWVEAHLRPEDVPAGMFPQGTVSESGAWLRLDPTPSMDELDDIYSLNLLDYAYEWMNYAQLLWHDYILELNHERQMASIYGPVVQFFKEGWDSLFRSRPDRSGSDSGAEESPPGSRGWAVAGRNAAFYGLGALFVTVFIVLGFVWRRRRQRATLEPRALAKGEPLARTVVPFYERLEQLFAQADLLREDGQTQLEFAVAASHQLSNNGASGRLSSLPQHVVAEFYRVRFGGGTLDKTAAADVEQSLAKIEEAVQAASRESPGSPEK